MSLTSLLHVNASPRGAASESLAIAETFLTAFGQSHPEVEVRRWDLWDGTLPEFGPAAAAAKMAVFAGADPEGEEAAAWLSARRTFERLASADAFLFNVPMWNHGIPYILKQLIDVISQPGMVFGFDPDMGYTGLLRDRPAAVVYTSAVYGPTERPGFGRDFQSTYFDDWLEWAGVSDHTSITFRPDLVTADAAEGRRTAHDQALRLGSRFAVHGTAPSSPDGRLVP